MFPSSVLSAVSPYTDLLRRCRVDLADRQGSTVCGILVPNRSLDRKISIHLCISTEDTTLPLLHGVAGQSRNATRPLNVGGSVEL